MLVMGQENTSNCQHVAQVSFVRFTEQDTLTDMLGLLDPHRSGAVDMAERCHYSTLQTTHTHVKQHAHLYTHV